MPAFFIISGYIASPHNNLNAYKYIKEKFMVYILPFFIFCTIGIIANFIEGNFEFLDSDFYWKLFYLGQPSHISSGSGWFLWALFWGDLIFYFYKKEIEDKPILFQLFFIFTLFYIGIHILQLINGYKITRLPLKIDSGIMAAFFIIIGNLIREYKINRIINKHKIIYFILFLIITLLTAEANGWANMANCKYHNESLYFIASLNGFLTIFVLSKHLENSIFSKILKFVGTYSLAYFMLEGFVARYLDSLMGVVRLGTNIKQALYVSFIYYIILIPFAFTIGKAIKILTKRLKGR